MHNPPKLFLRFFRWFCHPDLVRPIEGDLMELYEERIQKLGKKQADWKFIKDVILLFRKDIIKPTEGTQKLNYYGMLKHNFKIGYRTLTRNKAHSIINIGGLAIGMTVAILISIWIFDELSFNKNHDNYDSIAKLYCIESGSKVEVSQVHPTGLGTLLENEYGDYFESIALVRQRIENRVIAVDDKIFTQGGYFVQQAFPEMFSLKMVHGRVQDLDGLSSIFLSRSLSEKLFGKENPFGKEVIMDARWRLTVKGVYEDLPRNSEFADATYFAPLNRYLEGWSSLNVWDNYNMRIYVQMKDGVDERMVSSLIEKAMLPHVDENTARLEPTLFLMPMKEWHLYAQFDKGELVSSKQLKFVWFFGIIGVFILGIACINFVNLSTASSEQRAKEIGIRKTMGSHRKQLIAQFLTESMLLVTIAVTLSLLLVSSLLPYFNDIAAKEMTIMWDDYRFWLSILAFIFFTGLLAGGYPALFLSSFNPVNSLKGKSNASTLLTELPRKVLVVFQFTISISLIIGTTIVYKQILLAKSLPVGYNQAKLVSLIPRSPEYYQKYDVLKDELKNTGLVENTGSANYSVLSTLGWNTGFDWDGKNTDSNPAFNTIRISHDYGKTIGLEFVQGRDFNAEFANESANVIINESALRIMGFQDPIGKSIQFREDWFGHPSFQIIGVVKDMIKGSPYEPTFPSIMFLSDGGMQNFYLRIKENVSAKEALPVLAEVFEKVVPSAPFDYQFVDDEYNRLFQAEESIGRLAAILAMLAILISCLGLFGLSSFVVEKRSKEVGIRKVLGASVFTLWKMLSKDFLLLVVTASSIAIPLSYYFLNNWLQGYTFRTEISWWVLGAACAIAIFITLLTISQQAFKTAFKNPVETLKDE
ncbi:FtsX-like permease family protein [Ekhidna sp.]|uniref:FtsX-like permease family protein n=1 Tax=Ekhidna sp. TaxID=2608089 RepID=UPI003BACD65A